MAIKASWLRLHVSEEKSFAAIDKRSIGMPIHLFIIIYQLWKSKLTWPSLIGFVHEEELLWRIKSKIDLTFLLKTAFNVSTHTKFGYLVNLLETSTQIGFLERWVFCMRGALFLYSLVRFVEEVSRLRWRWNGPCDGAKGCAHCAVAEAGQRRSTVKDAFADVYLTLVLRVLWPICSVLRRMGPKGQFSGW